MWGRLGYPRRAIRLHAAASAIVAQHGGRVPSDHSDLLALPGIGSYTAAAVASFAFGGRHAVIDTNVRRVFTRVISGVQFPAAALTAAETRLAESLLPADAATAARWGAASMELGALLCTARKTRCDLCPIAPQCAWLLDGRPEYDGPPRRGQLYEGTDRQIRGTMLAALRATDEPLAASALLTTVEDRARALRCLASLVEDGLVATLTGERYELPRT
jgi:A/G-specific adenine glycosylase